MNKNHVLIVAGTLGIVVLAYIYYMRKHTGAMHPIDPHANDYLKF